MIHDAVVQTWIPSRRPAVMVRSAVPNVSFEFFALLVHTTIYYQVSIIPRTGYQYKQCSIRTINTRYNLLRVLAVSAPSNPEILEVQQYLEHRTPKYYFGIYESRIDYTSLENMDVADVAGIIVVPGTSLSGSCL